MERENFDAGEDTQSTGQCPVELPIELLVGHARRNCLAQAEVVRKINSLSSLLL